MTKSHRLKELCPVIKLILKLMEVSIWSLLKIMFNTNRMMICTLAYFKGSLPRKESSLCHSRGDCDFHTWELVAFDHCALMLLIPPQLPPVPQKHRHIASPASCCVLTEGIMSSHAMGRDAEGCLSELFQAPL